MEEGLVWLVSKIFFGHVLAHAIPTDEGKGKRAKQEYPEID